ncbi:MAG: hypothetical protein ACPG5B_07955 [Chitinophagales bacterium]
MNEHLFQQTKQLIYTDFELKINTEKASNENFEAFREYLAKAIENLMYQDMPFFLNALYRLDVSETRAMKALKNQTKLPPKYALADLIIEREVQKVQSRLWYKERMKEQSVAIKDDIEFW